MTNIFCLFGYHEWYSTTPIDELDNYEDVPQDWYCRRQDCTAHRLTYDVQTPTPVNRGKTGDLTWRCDACKRERFDRHISVLTVSLLNLPGGFRNWKYCNDRAQCRRKVEEFAKEGRI